MTRPVEMGDAHRKGGRWLTTKRRDFLALSAALTTSLSGTAIGQDLLSPERLPKNLRLLVPSPAGGAPDLVARTLSESWGRSHNLNATVMNVEGANGEIALARFLREPPSGGSWLLAQDSVIVVNPGFYPRASADILEGLIAVAQVGSNFFYLLVKQDDPINNLDDLVRIARRSTVPLHYGSGGVGSQHHLLMQDLARQLGLQLNHVPYRGNAPAVNGLAGGEVRVLMAGSSSLPLVRAGRLRLIAVTSPGRSTAFPGVPAIAEIVPGFHGTAWFGLFGRAGTAAEQLSEMLTLTQRAMLNPQTQMQLRERGNISATFCHGQVFRELIESEHRRFASIAARHALDR